MKEHLVSMYAYGEWVNQRLLEAAAALTGEQFADKFLPGYGSVHLTLVHIRACGAALEANRSPLSLAFRAKSGNALQAK